MSFLLITVRWHDHRYHGLLGRDGPPEWPPSPFRLFQALVAGLAQGGVLESTLGESLRELQKLAPPTIIAPRQNPGQVITHYVPNNDGDKKPDRQERLKGKVFRPTLMCDPPEIHYLWSINSDEFSRSNAELVCKAARYLTCLGWGIDTAYSDGRLIESEKTGGLTGQRWHPQRDFKSGRGCLRVPIYDAETGDNTLDDLKRAHESALARIQSGKPLYSADKPKTYQSVFYQSGQEHMPCPFAAFSLLTPNAETYRSFDPVRQGKCVAGMLRHLASDKSIMNALGWPLEKVNRLVLGHAEPEGQPHLPVDGPRLAFLPLPSLEYRGGKGSVVGSIRRVLVTGLRGFSQKEVNQVAQLLSGRSLVDEDTKKAVAFLSRLPNSEKMVRQYTEKATTWYTVTPVVLPGYDDPRKYRERLFAKEDQGESRLKSEEQEQLLGKLDARTELLLRKAIRQAGYSEELAQNAKLDWRGSGFWPGTDLASRYAVPEKLRRFRRLHVRITWTDDRGNLLGVPGPLCLGSGRFAGLGLFAPMPSV